MMDVSRETAEKLQEYAALIRKWNPHINLVAPATLADLETRHIEDCLQLLSYVDPDTDSWCDLGSGGGFPGLVLAIGRPDIAVTLVESDRRKASFLQTVVRELSLGNTRILAERIESIPCLGARNISARALAPLSRLLSHAYLHLDPTGTAWLMKGRNWKSELAEARKAWKFLEVVYPSRTDPEAAILAITEIEHA